jgi:hypothetical protein
VKKISIDLVDYWKRDVIARSDKQDTDGGAKKRLAPNDSKRDAQSVIEKVSTKKSSPTDVSTIVDGDQRDAITKDRPRSTAKTYPTKFRSTGLPILLF